MRKNNAPKPDSCYVHVPFCRALCPYCDFPKVIVDPRWTSPYLNALEKEAKARCDGLFSTIYIGGGTPSCLSDEDFERLLSFFRTHLKEGGEYSVECNPDSLSKTKVGILARCGVNRVSIGAQTSTPKGLKTLGRTHDFATVKEKVGLLKKAGITNINVDWMYGYPNETDEDIRDDIDAFLSLDVPHLSAYSLILEPGTVYSAKRVKPLDDDVQQGQFEQIRDALLYAGYGRYEVSNFARPGYRCKHNLTYWRDERYVGLGLGAAGYVGDVRYTNTKNLTKYIQGHYEGESEELSVEEERKDFLLTNLRLTEGFALDAFESRFGESFSSRYGPTIDDLVNRGLFVIEDGYARCTSHGMDLLDTVLLALY